MRYIRCIIIIIIIIIIIKEITNHNLHFSTDIQYMFYFLCFYVF